MAINKLFAGNVGNPANSKGSDVAASVNALIDLQNAQVISGDVSAATEAVFAQRLDGQVKWTRAEKNVNQTHRPVWVDMDYLINPPTGPLTDVDYHGVDIYGDIAVSSYSVDLSKAQMYLFESKTFYSGTATIKGNYAGFFEASNNSTGTVGDNVALRLWARNRSSGIINNNYCILTTATANSGTINNNYGIYLNNISGGVTSNFAIYTNLGKVSFGDDVYCRSATSKVNTESGRLLRVGDFGIGTANVQTGIDLDTVNYTGSLSGNNFVNSPSNAYFYIRTTVHSSLYREQWASGMTGGTREKIYRRVMDNGVWQPWRELALV